MQQDIAAPETVSRDARCLAYVLVVLVVTDVLLINQDMWLTVPVACLACVLLLVIGRRAGLSLADVGLSRAGIRPGLRWGAASALLVAGGYLLVAVLPFTESAFDDDSMPATAGAVAVKVLVVIPLRTIVLEELAFRGVLWGLLRRRYGARQATWWSAAAFGLWHVPAGLRLLDSNEALASASEGSWLIGAAVVIAIVAFTAAAGIVFAEMRRRSGSLLAPAGLHWATNSIGTVLSAVK